MPFYAAIGPRAGPYLSNDARDFAAIFGVPADTPGLRRAIGLARRVGRNADGAAVWELTIHDVEIPGRWVIIDREFVPAQLTIGCRRSIGMPGAGAEPRR